MVSVFFTSKGDDLVLVIVLKTQSNGSFCDHLTIRTHSAFPGNCYFRVLLNSGAKILTNIFTWLKFSIDKFM